MSDLKTQLVKQAKNAEFKLAIVSQPDNVKNAQKQWVENPFFRELSTSFGRVEMIVQELLDDGLLYSAGDFYIYAGRGGIKVHETPKGVRKQLQRIASLYGLNIVVSDGVLYENDRISVKTDGKIDEIEIVKDQQTLTRGGNIICPYAVVTVFKDSINIVAKKLFIIPQNEYQKILNQGSGSSYPTMMAQKSVMKRVANGIYSLLGVSIGKESGIDEVEERLTERQSPQNIQTQKDTFEDEAVNTEIIETEVNFDEI